MTWELQRWLNLFECTNGGCSGRVDGGAYIYLWAAARAMARGSKATRDMDCVHKYVQHIADVSSPKAEYVRHFEAVTPTSRAVCAHPWDEDLYVDSQGTTVDGNDSQQQPSPGSSSGSESAEDKTRFRSR